MRRNIRGALASTSTALLVLAVLAGCSTDDVDDPVDTTASETTSEEAGEEAGAEDTEWFVQADYDEQDAQRSATFEGDESEPWLQYIDGEMTDTSEYKSGGAKKVCFANASVSNPWR